MTHDERMMLILAHQAEAARGLAAACELRISAIKLAASGREFLCALAAGDARDIAAHPDLAELNVQMDGYYGAS